MTKIKRHRSKACAECEKSSETMYRIKTQDLYKWVIVCPNCQARLKDELGYLYGGTWKAAKRH